MCVCVRARACVRACVCVCVRAFVNDCALVCISRCGCYIYSVSTSRIELEIRLLCNISRVYESYVMLHAEQDILFSIRTPKQQQHQRLDFILDTSLCH